MRRLKPILPWLLVLTLSLQGAATAAMLFCGPVDHRHAAAAHEGHHHPASSHGDAMHDAARGNGCSQCCAFAILTFTLPAPVSAKPAAALPSLLTPALPLFSASGPDRPPRILLV